MNVVVQLQVVNIRRYNIVPNSPTGFHHAHAGEEEAAGQDAVHVADIEAYKVKDLWLELEVMSPVSSAGSYSVTVVLYDGGEPVQAAGSAAGITAQSQFKVCQCCSIIITVCLAPGVQEQSMSLLSADDSIQCKGRKSGANLGAVPFVVELCFVNAQLGHAACSVDPTCLTAPGL